MPPPVVIRSQVVPGTQRPARAGVPGEDRRHVDQHQIEGQEADHPVDPGQLVPAERVLQRGQPRHHDHLHQQQIRGPEAGQPPDRGEPGLPAGGEVGDAAVGDPPVGDQQQAQPQRDPGGQPDDAGPAPASAPGRGIPGASASARVSRVVMTAARRSYRRPPSRRRRELPDRRHRDHRRGGGGRPAVRRRRRRRRRTDARPAVLRGIGHGRGLVRPGLLRRLDVGDPGRGGPEGEHRGEDSQQRAATPAATSVLVRSGRRGIGPERGRRDRPVGPPGLSWWAVPTGSRCAAAGGRCSRVRPLVHRAGNEFTGVFLDPDQCRRSLSPRCGARCCPPAVRRPGRARLRL